MNRVMQFFCLERKRVVAETAQNAGYIESGRGRSWWCLLINGERERERESSLSVLREMRRRNRVSRCFVCGME